MSQPSPAAGTSSGVVRNSALSFVPEQAAPAHEAMAQDPKDQMGQEADRLVPAGLKALCEAYTRLYPDQPNPLQVTTRLKYWLGGQDPLDYISMYWNPGKPEENIPPHWHYVSFGMSDLHGDGRVHAPPDRLPPGAPPPDPGALPPSGLGAELTLRLAADAPQPPLWPARLLQALARYVFTTGNKFCAGDHISWHAPLDGTRGPRRSRVRHLLVAGDPQLRAVATPHGSVHFLQMVGCTGRELRAAQRGSGFDVLKKISEDPRCGAGAWLVTRVGRRRSARGVSRHNTSPAQLAGVSAPVRWTPLTPSQTPEEAPASPAALSPTVEQMIKDTLQRGLTTMSDRSGPEGHMSTDSFEMSSIERALPQVPESMQGSWRGEDSIEYYDGIHLMLNAEGASLLPLAIDGRVRHGRHFTWRQCGRAVTLVPHAVAGALAAASRPYVASGCWLQIYIPKQLAEDMSKKVSNLSSLAETDSESDSEDERSERDREPTVLPLTLSWPQHKLQITVLSDQDML